MTWKEWLQHNADKILLIVIFHGLMALMIGNTGNATLLDWLKGEAETVLGALLMLITGRSSRPDPVATATTTITSSLRQSADGADRQ